MKGPVVLHLALSLFYSLMPSTSLAQQAKALCIGVNAVDPQHYKDQFVPLKNAENDADAMKRIARKEGFSVYILKGSQAVRSAVLNHIQNAAASLRDGDIFMLSFAGHGSLLPDQNDDEPEAYKYDQTWCLYDAQLVDDEIYNELSAFKPGVRIIIFSDSCHSGSIITVVGGKQGRDSFTASDKEWEDYRKANKIQPVSDGHLYRFLSPDVARNTYRANKRFYDNLLKNAKLATAKNLQASAISIVACEDNQRASDTGGANGVFTDALLQEWNDGKFSGNYPFFHETIRPTAKRKNPKQSAVFRKEGKEWPEFESQKPFSVTTPKRSR